MKLFIISLFSLTFTQNSFAGDAGYFSRTCVSASQRSVLTILNDYSDQAPIYTLVLDGVPAVYSLNDPSVSEAGDDGVLNILKNNIKIFKMDFNAKNGKMALTVYIDPREGTIAAIRATPTPINIELQCKDFWPEP